MNTLTTFIFVFSFVVLMISISRYRDNQYVLTHPTVRTQYGIVEGAVVNAHLEADAEVEQFLGIPYALPPVGDKRFAAPEPPETFVNGFIAADRYPSLCMQKQYFDPELPMSEDCLFLNIYRPRPIRKNRAVMVWIHGGAFIRMFSYSDYYQTNNATTLAYFGDVIVVTIHYRLAIFGSLHTGDKRIEGGNFGLKDQQMALRWVHENIKDFGGDPNLVTIFGESAGGHSVNNLLLLPENQNLFTRAIVQTGSSTSYRGCLSIDYITQNIAHVSERTGCANDDNFVACLRNIPALQLLDQTWPPSNILKIPYIPAADGETIQEMPIELLKKGKVLRKDILIGMNRNEGTKYVGNMIPGVTFKTIRKDPAGAYRKAVEELARERVLTLQEIEAIDENYRPAHPDNETETLISIGELYGDVTYKCPIQEAAKEYNRLGMKVYQYYLNYRASKDTNPLWMGVTHTMDIQWVFGHPFDPTRGLTKDERSLSRDVMAWWTNFAKYGYTFDSWRPYSCEGPSYLRIDGPGQYPFFTNSYVDSDKCKLWGYNL